MFANFLADSGTCSSTNSSTNALIAGASSRQTHVNRARLTLLRIPNLAFTGVRISSLFGDWHCTSARTKASVTGDFESLLWRELFRASRP